MRRQVQRERGQCDEEERVGSQGAPVCLPVLLSAACSIPSSSSLILLPPPSSSTLTPCSCPSLCPTGLTAHRPAAGRAGDLEERVRCEDGEGTAQTEVHTALRSTALHCTSLHCTTLYCTELHCTSLHCILPHCSALSLHRLHDLHMTPALPTPPLSTLYFIPSSAPLESSLSLYPFMHRTIQSSFSILSPILPSHVPHPLSTPSSLSPPLLPIPVHPFSLPLSLAPSHHREDSQREMEAIKTATRDLSDRENRYRTALNCCTVPHCT